MSDERGPPMSMEGAQARPPMSMEGAQTPSPARLHAPSGAPTLLGTVGAEGGPRSLHE